MKAQRCGFALKGRVGEALSEEWKVDLIAKEMRGVETEGCADAIIEYFGKGLLYLGFNGKSESLERCIGSNGCRVWQCHRETSGKCRNKGLSVADFVDGACIGYVLVSLLSACNHRKAIQSRAIPAI